jgi:hypothetical protein
MKYTELALMLPAAFDDEPQYSPFVPAPPKAPVSRLRLPAAPYL